MTMVDIVVASKMRHLVIFLLTMAIVTVKINTMFIIIAVITIEEMFLLGTVMTMTGADTRCPITQAVLKIQLVIPTMLESIILTMIVLITTNLEGSP